MAKQTMGVSNARGWLVVVHGPEAPANHEWDIYLEVLEKQGAELRGQLIFSLGGAPSSAQRSKSIKIGEAAFEARKAKGLPKLRSAVMTGSSVVRGLATMFNWFFDNTFKGFTLDDWAGAFAHLGVVAEDGEALRAAVSELRRQID